MDDTIAAIATPPGEGGIGIIRISGEKSKKILEKIFKSASGCEIVSRKESLLLKEKPENFSRLRNILLWIF